MDSRNRHGANIIAQYLSSKLPVDMSQLQVHTKAPRKRTSTEAVRESTQSRKKATEIRDVPLEQSIEIDPFNMKAMTAELDNTREETHQQWLVKEEMAKVEGRRVQKEPQLRSQRFCCDCGERTEANANAPSQSTCGTCNHWYCMYCQAMTSKKVAPRIVD